MNLTNFAIKNGDVVGVTSNDSASNVSQVSGVVLHIQRSNLEVAINSHGSAAGTDGLRQGETYNLIKLANDVTYRRLKASVESMYKASSKCYLLRMLFGEEPLLEPLVSLPAYVLPALNEALAANNSNEDIVWFNQSLNQSQKDAIRFALNCRHLAVIHGPPGTGKTTTLTEVILQLITRGQKVFVFAPSNVAVDNIFKQLLGAAHRLRGMKKRGPGGGGGFNFIRLGHTARIDSDVQCYSLDAAVSSGEDTAVADLWAEFDHISRGGGYVPRGKLREIRKEIDQYETKAMREALKGADVIFSTLVSAGLNGQLKFLVEQELDPSAFAFENVIVDECAQALEAEAWIPLAHASRCILAGDHKQLGATIVSQEAAHQGLEISLMDRVADMYKGNTDLVFRMLTIQYRMNIEIMQWSSDYFYAGRLVAHDGVKDRRLVSQKVKSEDGSGHEVLPVIRLIDTTGCDMYELEGSLSKGNRAEADIVVIYVRQLIEEHGLAPASIGIISPYRLQISLIETRCRQVFADAVMDQLEIQSVDGFQGREKEVIIFSLVRSNKEGEIGFLIEERRLNVAITRARSHLVVVCDSDTVCKDKGALASFIDYCYDHADIVTAADYEAQLAEYEDIQLVVRAGRTGIEGKKKTDKAGAEGGGTNAATNNRKNNNKTGGGGNDARGKGRPARFQGKWRRALRHAQSLMF